MGYPSAMRWMLLCAICWTCCGVSIALAQQEAGGRQLGISWPSFHAAAYDKPEARIERLARLGVQSVTLVPTYFYADRNRIDASHTPSWRAQQRLVTRLLAKGIAVVYKPHLDPPMYGPGFDILHGDYDSWRATCPWRGYFDVNPCSAAYRGLVDGALAMLGQAISSAEHSAAGRARSEGPRRSEQPPHSRQPIRHEQSLRFELGSELMNSVVAFPRCWVALSRNARKQLQELGLRKKLRLSHNFSHHFAHPGDLIRRMPPSAQRALADYIRSLDDLALSQYGRLDRLPPGAESFGLAPRTAGLSASVARTSSSSPSAAASSDTESTSAARVARVLRWHERHLREHILQQRLGLRRSELPVLHFGEFGIGRGGLRHPNLWQNQPLSTQGKAQLKRERRLAMQALALFLADRVQGQRDYVQSVTLWVTGADYDVLGLDKDTHRDGIAAGFLERYWSARQ